MAVLLEKRGSRKPNRPDCSVDVVDATMIERSCAKEAPCPVKAKTVANAINRCFMSLILHFVAGRRRKAISCRVCNPCDDRNWPMAEICCDAALRQPSEVKRACHIRGSSGESTPQPISRSRDYPAPFITGLTGSAQTDRRSMDLIYGKKPIK